jgi:para-nitrobenzyl esterase
MSRQPGRSILAATILLAAAFVNGATAAAPDRVRTANGVVEGAGRQASGVRVFRGIAFAEPPVGALRWREPQALKSWQGVRQAVKFGPRCMQAAIFGDMGFRSDAMSEDCLYLNVWTPARSGKERLPVLVYFYGGGFVAGAGDEPRYDGESMAARGIVSVTLNYRLGVFGFLAHPELTRESPHRASGNYGLLDQAAALQWVRENIAAFGGDPARVTVAGESAGSVSVSAQMASPLSKTLIAGAIGESGAITGTLPAVPREQAEAAGAKFAEGLGANSLAALRALGTEEIFAPATAGGFASVGRFPITVDGHFFTEDPALTYAAGRQARVPLLAGWNSEEMTWMFLFRGQEPTPENYEKILRELYGERSGEVLKLYPGATRDGVVQSATDLAGDRFIAFATWKWIELHARTGQPIFRYFYTRARPAMRAALGNATAGLAGGVVRNQGAPPPQPPARGAVHSAEIEYALGNLSTNNVYAWTPDDYKVSKVMQEYFANFIKRGDPNGAGLPAWPPAGRGDNAGAKVMRIDVEARAEPDTTRARYLFLDQLSAQRR